jgi:hypothetical protein
MPRKTVKKRKVNPKRKPVKLEVDDESLVSQMDNILTNSKQLSIVLVHSPACGPCRRFREEKWDKLMRMPRINNNVMAIRNDLFDRSRISKNVKGLEYLPSLIVVDEKGVPQTFEGPEGPTNVMPTPQTLEDLVRAANVQPTSPAMKETPQTLDDLMRSVNIKPSPFTPFAKDAINAANQAAKIANTRAVNANKAAMAIRNNSSAQVLRNAQMAANSARAAAEGAKEAAKSVMEALHTMQDMNKERAMAAANRANSAASAANLAAENVVSRTENLNQSLPSNSMLAQENMSPMNYTRMNETPMNSTRMNEPPVNFTPPPGMSQIIVREPTSMTSPPLLKRGGGNLLKVLQAYNNRRVTRRK